MINIMCVDVLFCLYGGLFLFKTQSHYRDLAGLELIAIPLPQPFKCYNYRCGSHLIHVCVLSNHYNNFSSVYKVIQSVTYK